jgi:hypothetical protein
MILFHTNELFGHSRSELYEFRSGGSEEMK